MSHERGSTAKCKNIVSVFLEPVTLKLVTAIRKQKADEEAGLFKENR